HVVGSLLVVGSVLAGVAGFVSGVTTTASRRRSVRCVGVLGRSFGRVFGQLLGGGRAGGGEQVEERPRLPGQVRARALLDHASAGEDGHLLSALGGAQPVGDEDAGAAAQQLVGGSHDAVFGERVHACGG